MRQPFGATLVAGDAWKWAISVGDVRAATGTQLKYSFRGTSSQALDLAATLGADGLWQFTATSEQTANLAGELAWQLCVYDADSNRTELARGSVTVLADIAAAQNFDGRSWNRRMLDAICAVLEGRATRVEKQYQIAGRQLELLSLDELFRAQEKFQTLVNAELAASGQKRSGGNQVLVRFGGSGGTGGWR